MGVVYKACDPELKRHVAIKLLAPQWSVDPGARRRFQREAQSAAAISHPHVVTIHAVGECGGRPYLVMEFVPGSTLEDHLEQNGPLPLAQVLTIGAQVASALAAAHGQGLIHRDIKPGNILLENDLPRARLTDFGLARAVDDARLTQEGVVAGTPQYMAPEQARGLALDRRADLFSLGCVLYAMSTGESAFQAGPTPDVLRRVCGEEPPSPRSVYPEVPVWLEQIIARLMAKDPSARFDSAREVADLLERHLARLRDPALPEVEHTWLPVPEPSRPRRHPALRPVLMGMAGVVAAVATYVITPEPPPTPRVALAGGPTPAAPASFVVAHPEPDHLIAAYSRDFMKQGFDPAHLRLICRAGLEPTVQPDPNGMRITIPKGLGESVGISTKFRIEGDFEITASYAILDVGRPATGYGVGPELAIKPPGDWKKFASLAYHHQKDDTTVLAATHGFTDPAGQGQVEGRWPPTTARVGRLRLIRVGPRVHYVAGEGGDGPFRELYSAEFGTSPIEMAKLGLDVGGSIAPAEVLWKDFQVRAEKLPGLALESAHAGRIWLLSGLGVLAAVAGLLLWYMGRRKRSRD